MTSFNGQPVFRSHGKSRDNQMSEWSKTANRVIGQGGRIYQSQSGDMHIVSPSGAHWGTFRAKPEMFEGGTLSKYEPDEGSYDITSKFQRNGY